MIPLSVRPCKVTVHNIPFKHVLWPGALDLHFMLQWLCHNFTSALALKSVFQTLHAAVVVSLQLWLFLCSCDCFSAAMVVSLQLWLFLCSCHTGVVSLQLSHSGCFPAAVVAESVWPSVIFGLNIIFQHTLWSGDLDIHFHSSDLVIILRWP